MIAVDRETKRANYASQVSGAAPGAKPGGFTAGIRNRLAKRIPINTPPPISTGTGSGTAAVYQPPTVQAPQNASDAVMQQLATSLQLQENTATGAGTGAGRVSNPVSYTVKTPGAYMALAALAAILVLAYAWDKGKL